MPLRVIPQRAYIDPRLFEIGRDLDCADGDQRARKRQFSQDDQTELALKDFTHPLNSVFHGKFGVGDLSVFRRPV